MMIHLLQVKGPLPVTREWETRYRWMEKCGSSSVPKIFLSAVCKGASCLFDRKVGPPWGGRKTGGKEEGGLDGPGGEGKKGKRGLLHGLYERQGWKMWGRGGRSEGEDERGKLVQVYVE